MKSGTDCLRVKPFLSGRRPATACSGAIRQEGTLSPVAQAPRQKPASPATSRAYGVINKKGSVRALRIQKESARQSSKKAVCPKIKCQGIIDRARCSKTSPDADSAFTGRSPSHQTPRPAGRNPRECHLHGGMQPACRICTLPSKIFINSRFPVTGFRRLVCL